MARLEDAVETLEDQLFELNKGIAASYELREFLANTAVPAEEKKRALSEILSPTASPLLRYIVETLVSMNRADLIQEVAESYVSFVEQEKNRVLAEVTSAIQLTSDLTDKLASELAKITGKTVSVKNVVDQQIVGGLVIKLENKVIDLSLRRKLDDLRDSLQASLS